MNNREIGTKYELIAKEYLQNQGMKVLECNYRCRQGEIDLIGLHGNYLVFVEVKYRKSKKAGTSEEAVGIAKQKKICQVAAFFLYTHRQYGDCMIRYDVVAVNGEELRWYQAAFEHIGRT